MPERHRAQDAVIDGATVVVCPNCRWERSEEHAPNLLVLYVPALHTIKIICFVCGLVIADGEAHVQPTTEPS